MVKKNLVIQTAFVGDLLLSIPMLKRLRKSRPDDQLHLLCRAGLGDFFLKTELVDEVIEFDKGQKQSSKNQEALNQLKEKSFEWVICPHESMTSAKIVAGLRASEKIGFHKFWNFFAFNQRSQRPMHLPEALRQLSLLTPFDSELAGLMEGYLPKDSPQSQDVLNVNRRGSLPDWSSMSLAPFSRTQLQRKIGEDPEFSASMEKVFQLAQATKCFDKELVLLAPGSVWATKRWSLEGYMELGRTLRRRGFHVAVIGAPEELDIAEELTAAVPGASNFCGKTSLFETFLFMQKSKAIVCNDSGAMHLAAAASLPTVALFGPTTLELGYRPWQERAAVVQVDLSCRPCGKHGSEKCPISTHQCMKDINELMVLEALDQVLMTD